MSQKGGQKADPRGPQGPEKTDPRIGSVDPPRVSGIPGVDYNELSHARKGMEPTPDPLRGQSLVDVEGNMKHISPHGVNSDQYFPDVDVDAKGRVRSMGAFEARTLTGESKSETNDNPQPASESNPKHSKEYTMDSTLLGTESTSLNVGLVSREVTESEQADLPPSIEWTEAGQTATGTTKDDKQTETETETDQQQQQPPQKEEEDDGSVFTTQVDEETLDAAKERQKRENTLIEIERPSSRQQTVTMSEVLTEKADEHFSKAVDHMSEGRYEQAITRFNKALNLCPKEILFYVQRAEAFLQLCDFQSAILNYKRVCVLNPDSFQHYSRLALVYYLQGQCLFDQKLYPEALEAFSRAAEMRPEVVGYHTRSIACLAALQRHGECLALVNKRLESENDNADLYVMRARLHQLFRNTTLCYYDVKDALAIDPAHPEAQRVMILLESRALELKQQATQLNLLGRHRDALQKISIAIETNPSVADFHVLRGALHRRLGDFNAAIDDYLLALDKTDHNEESAIYQEGQRQLLLTYNDFAVECFTKGFYDEAIILLNKAIKGEKREKGLYINRGDCFYKEGSLQFALADYHQALELSPNDDAVSSRIAVIHNEYGVSEYADKNYQEAESQFTLAIQNNPRIGQYYVSRCKARQMMENMPAARQDALMALHLDPSNEEIVGILSRLFPGKTVRDVLASRAAEQVRTALENLVVMAQPIKLDPTEPKPIGASSETQKSSDEKSADFPPVAGSLWKPGGCFPDLKACMQEKQFYIKVADEKKKINNRVKDALLNRRSLKYTGGRVKEMPDVTPIPPKSKKSQGGSTYGQREVPIAATQSTGWRKFNLGVGIKNT